MIDEAPVDLDESRHPLVGVWIGLYAIVFGPST